MVASITSGPIPSPGTRRSLYSFIGIFSLNPGLLDVLLLLEGRDLVFGAHGQADIVPAIEQALLAEFIDLERDHAAVRTADLLLLQIDRDDGVGTALGIVHQLVDLGLGQLDRQDAVLEAVAIEDVGEAGRDDAANAEIQQRPGRMLAG